VAALIILDMGLATFFSVLFIFIGERGHKEVFGRDGGVLKVKYLGFWAYFRLLGLECFLQVKEENLCFRSKLLVKRRWNLRNRLGLCMSRERRHEIA
jgi:hypothetical protein